MKTNFRYVLKAVRSKKIPITLAKHSPTRASRIDFEVASVVKAVK